MEHRFRAALKPMQEPYACGDWANRGLTGIGHWRRPRAAHQLKHFNIERRGDAAERGPGYVLAAGLDPRDRDCMQVGLSRQSFDGQRALLAQLADHGS